MKAFKMVLLTMATLASTYSHASNTSLVWHAVINKAPSNKELIINDCNRLPFNGSTIKNKKNSLNKLTCLSNLKEISLSPSAKYAGVKVVSLTY